MDHNLYKKLQELLPDYVFGKLNQTDIDFFETNVQLFPDLTKEVEDVKNVFSKFDKMELDNNIAKSSRNIAYKVIEKREQNKNYKYKYSSNSYLLRFILPVALFIAIGIFYFQLNNKNTNIQPQKTEFTEKVDNYIDDIINKVASDTLENQNIEHQTASIQSTSNQNNDINLDEIEELSLADMPEYQYDILYTNNYEELNNLDTLEFQELYEEIKNAKINF